MSRVIHPGLSLPSHKQHSRDVAIAPLPAPDVLVLPLNQHSDVELIPCIEVGATVLRGQVIARPHSTPDLLLGAYLHAPVSGQVMAIEPRDTPHRDVAAALSIVIRNDHRDGVDTSCAPPSDWSQLAPLALCQLIARGGIAGLGGAVFPTATKLAAHTQQPIEYLLVNGVECEPYITCDDRLMRERAAQILRGVQILLHAAQAGHCIIAIEADKPEALLAMQAALSAANDARITIRSIATAYPSGDEGQLITQLLGREVPRAALPTDVGVIVQNVATAYACARWIEQGEPLISRIVTVTGTGIHRPANLEVSLGTPISAVVAACGGYRSGVSTNQPVDTLIMGGAMMGLALAHDHLPIVKASNCLIVEHHAALKPVTLEMPCIRCGECAEACPAHLLPQQLLAFLLASTGSNNRIALKQLGLSDCIECGCCDYVCPSNITLAARFHAAKRQAEH
jgi:electron transport complex protein RnfC